MTMTKVTSSIKKQRKKER